MVYPPQVLLEGVHLDEGSLVLEATLQRTEQLTAAAAPGRRLMSGHGSVYREEAFWAEAEEEEGHVGASLRRQMLHDLGGIEPPHEQPQNLRNGEVGYDTTDGAGDRLREMGRRCAAAAAARRRRTARGGSKSGDEGGHVAAPVLRLTRGGWLPDAASAMPAGEAMGEETYCRWWPGVEGALSTEEDGTEGRGDGVSPWAGEAAAAEEEAEEAVLGAAFLPMRGATVPLFYFSLRLDVFVGAAEVGAAVGPSVGPGEAAVAAAKEEEEALQERGKGEEAERDGVTSMERQEQERAVVAQGEGWEAANAAIEALSLDERVAGWSLPQEGQSADAALQASSLAEGACALCLPAYELHARCTCTACACACTCSARRALRRGRLQTGQLTGRVWTIRTRRSWPMLRPCGAQQLWRARRAPRRRCHPDAVRRPRKRRRVRRV